MESDLCINCKNYIGDLSCRAFPDGIPQEILLGENDHSEPLPEQENDIVFEQMDEDGERNSPFIEVEEKAS